MAHKVLEIYIDDDEIQKNYCDSKWFQTNDSIVISMSTLKSILSLAKQREEENASDLREKLHKNAKLEKYWNKLSLEDEFHEGNCDWTERFY